jgi:hypothetical protein
MRSATVTASQLAALVAAFAGALGGQTPCERLQQKTTAQTSQ